MMTKQKLHAMNPGAVKATAAALLVFGLAFSHAPAQADMVMPGVYNLFDHPAGVLTAEGPPAVSYGLRLDSFCNSATMTAGTCNSSSWSADRTFSVEGPGAGVTLD